MAVLPRPNKAIRTTAIPTRPKVWIGIGCVAALAVTYWALAHSGALDLLQEPDRIRNWVAGLGGLGPVAVMAAMAVAIVISPLPSAPIALAAGALYGHTWGTLYVIIGAECGALAAFAIARALGQDMISRWIGTRPLLQALNSQNTLTLAVFVARLMPFLSFDVISYAAGLSPLRLWRFALATLLGITPISFVLAHFGGELGSGDMNRILLTIAVLGGFTALSVFCGGVWHKWTKSRTRL